MKKIVVLLCSLSGIGLLTAVTVLAETNGFELICNKRQLASYAGFDVKGYDIIGEQTIADAILDRIIHTAPAGIKR